MELVTTDKIISWLKDQVENKNPVSPQTWLDAALKLTVLMDNESDELATLEMKVAQAKYEILKNQEKKSVALAEVEVESTDLYRQMRIKKAKIDRILEFVRLAKKQATIRENQIQNI